MRFKSWERRALCWSTGRSAKEEWNGMPNNGCAEDRDVVVRGCGCSSGWDVSQQVRFCPRFRSLAWSILLNRRHSTALETSLRHRPYYFWLTQPRDLHRAAHCGAMQGLIGTYVFSAITQQWSCQRWIVAKRSHWSRCLERRKKLMSNCHESNHLI